MTLNTLQQQAADGLVEFATKKEHTFALLLGPAGSGKTFTISHVIKALGPSKRRIMVACPTHKAKSVLVKSLARYGISVSATTVSALIGKAPSITDDPDEEGQAQWKRGGGDTLQPGSLLVVDEISMVDVADMRAIKRAVEASKAQAILTGDFAQLRPVKGTSIMEAVEKIPVRFKLNEVMRSGSQGIVAVSKAVRTTGQIDLDAIDNQTVFSYHSSDKFEQTFVATEDAVAVAYTNKRVSELNKMKRRALYGDDPPDFMPKESVILTEAPFFIWARGSKTGNYSSIKAADNNSQLIVRDAGFLSEATHPFSERKVPYYDLYLHNPETNLDFEAKGMTFDMYVNHLKPTLEDALGNIRAFADRLTKIDKEVQRRFERGGIDEAHKNRVTEAQMQKFFKPQEFDWLLKAVEKNPKYFLRSFDFTTDEGFFFPAKGAWSSLRGLLWARDYFGFRQQFAVLLYEHASTAHKAQGSTYKHVFVDWPNLETIRDHEDRQAASYVAVSRASDTLHIRV
jgi:hypothetical protein